jgi:hypothetical protein
MADSILTKDDIKDITDRGITEDTILRQIEVFKKGFPFSRLVRPCIPKDGIVILDENDIARLIKKYDSAANSGRCMKFVPASGAASRMFKLLSSFRNSHDNITKDTLSSAAEDGDDNSKLLLRFINEIRKYPFFDSLKSSMSKAGEDLERSLLKGDIKKILEYVLDNNGLNFSDTPKGLIPFHRYGNYSRTPFEEHLVEGAAYAKDKEGVVNIHFTVSQKYKSAVSQHIESVLNRYEENGTKYKIDLSCQKPSTDTIAVDLNNKPFRDKDGRLLFRPGGHGALLENLSDIKGDIIFIKNIDNVVPDRLKDTTYIYKKALGGYLIELQEEIFGYLQRLLDNDPDVEFIDGLFDFVREKLCIIPPEGIHGKPPDLKKEYLISTLNRPLRACGMVRNVGEPGGGPFWVHNSGKGISIQIVETSQMDMSSEVQNEIFHSSTHFNPVDLVCGVRDYSGKSFDLSKYVDHNAGFISSKSKDGKDLKALELPGLWNGSMAFWNSVFVEVPEITFNPVKTIFDLLRDEHQPG